MSLHLITGYAGQAHITAADHASFNISMFGDGEFVFDRGNKFAAEIISNNLIRILDGDMMIQGRHVRLQENTYEEVIIENGSQGMYRNDLIVARYSKDSTTGVEKCEFVVLKGEASANAAVDPEYTVGDITEQGNELVTEFPLYRIKLNGLNIESVVRLFDIEKTLQAYKDETVAYIKSTVGYCNKNLFKYITDGFEYNGIVAQKNSDGSMTVTGTATDTVDYQIGVDIYPENEQYILSGYTEGADADCNIYAAYWEDASTWKSAEAVLDDKGVLITKTKGNICKVCLYVAKGKTVNIKFYPMVRYASIKDNTYEPYVEDLDIRVNRLYGVEKIYDAKSFTTSTDYVIAWTYKATKKCLLNGNIRFTYNNGYPVQLGLYRDGTTEPFALSSSNETLYDKTLPFSLVLEKDEQIIARVKYSNATSNAYIVNGYVQYLE